ncbi:hypothetical protein [Natronococcus roseus]|uniref:hypothetical protein n=1 Tax=Natronococcus roseus TaxID=1052014 RepID=UPI00374D10DD
MSTETTPATTERLNSIERRLEEMVERKWTPLREKNESEPIEVQTTDDGVAIGYVNKMWCQLLMDDVIRTFDTGHHEFRHMNTEQGWLVKVRPISASKFYEGSDWMDVRRAAVIEALDKTGIHVPKVLKSGKAAWLKHFETEREAEQAATVLENPIEAAYEEMCNGSVEELEVREFEEPREWLIPDPCYSVLVHYD